MVQWLINPTRNHEVAGSIPDPWPRSVGQGFGVVLSWGVGGRRGSDPTLLWLWHRLGSYSSDKPLAWEPPYAAGAALEKGKKTQQQQQKKSKDGHQFPDTPLIKRWALCPRLLNLGVLYGFFHQQNTTRIMLLTG